LKSNQQESKMTFFLADILKMLNQKKKVNIRNIQDMIDIFLPKYQNFEISLSNEFIVEFYEQLFNEIKDV
jgi:hypothetical protein